MFTRIHTIVITLSLSLLAAGCNGDDGGMDVGSDVAVDLGIDAGQQDTGAEDTGPEDTGPEDTGPEDTGPEDTGLDGGLEDVADVSTDTGTDVGADTGMDAGDASTDAGPDTGIIPQCGDGITHPMLGEECDDGNLMDGDGCSQNCTIEDIIVDLAPGAVTVTTERRINGSVANGQFSYHTVGDVTGDGAVELVVGERGAQVRGTAYAFATGTDFFNTVSSTVVRTSTVQSGTVFQIVGEEMGDEFGAGFPSGLFIADVTGDQIGDLVVTAVDGDGELNGRDGAGELYVFEGGATLEASGVLDLSTSTASVHARIIGPVADGEAHVVAVGDLDQDDIDDIVVSVPRASPQARNLAGAVYVIKGGAGLTGTIDLSLGLTHSQVIAVIDGATAQDTLARAAAIGDISGDGVNDLLISATQHSNGTLTRAGSVWAFFGGVAGAIDLNTPNVADAQWLSGDIFGQLGTSIVIANVQGSADNELLIGSNQMLNPAHSPPDAQRGGVDVWNGPINAGVYDGAMGAIANTRIYGAERGDHAGDSVAAGDMNGDGFADLVVLSGAADGPMNLRTNAGEAAVFIGGMTLPASFDLELDVPPILVIGPRSPAGMGQRKNNVSVVDLDGDGKQDVCLAAWNGANGSLHCVRSPW